MMFVGTMWPHLPRLADAPITAIRRGLNNILVISLLLVVKSGLPVHCRINKVIKPDTKIHEKGQKPGNIKVSLVQDPLEILFELKKITPVLRCDGPIDIGDPILNRMEEINEGLLVRLPPRGPSDARLVLFL